MWRSFSGSINPINLHADIRLHLLELIPSKGQLFARARARESHYLLPHCIQDCVRVCVCWVNGMDEPGLVQGHLYLYPSPKVLHIRNGEGKSCRTGRSWEGESLFRESVEILFFPLDVSVCVCVCLCPLRYGNEGSSGSWEWGVSIENMAFWCSDFLVRVRGFVFLCVCSFPFLIVHQYPSRGRRARYQIIKNGPRQSFPLPDRGNTLKARKSCPTLCPLALPRGFSTLLFRAAALGANIPEKAQPVCYGYTVCVCFFCGVSADHVKTDPDNLAWLVSCGFCNKKITNKESASLCFRCWLKGVKVQYSKQGWDTLTHKYAHLLPCSMYRWELCMCAFFWYKYMHMGLSSIHDFVPLSTRLCGTMQYRST